MKMMYLLVISLFVSCSGTIVTNGMKVSGNIKEKSIEIPIINNIVTGIVEEEPRNIMITQNDIVSMESELGIIILLLPGSNIDSLRLTAENNEHEFVYGPEFRQIKNYFDANIELGYYSFVYIENKAWVSKGNDWIFSLFENEDLLVRRKVALPETDDILYDEYSESPFAQINLRRVKDDKEYTFKFDPDKTDIIVIYKYNDEDGLYIYYPICVFSVKARDGKIKIEWQNDSEKGMYCIRTYSEANIPREEKREAVFDYYDLK